LKEVVSHYDQKGTAVQLRFINNIQPWHPQAYYLSHVLAASNMIYKKKNNTRDETEMFKLIDKFFELQDQYSDAKVADRTPTEIYKELKKIASDTVNVSEEELEKVLNDDASATYVKVQIKYSRQNSVHVTPTVAVNGLIESSTSSSWDVSEWNKLLDPLLN
jgi:protein-disulfide isomerase